MNIQFALPEEMPIEQAGKIVSDLDSLPLPNRTKEALIKMKQMIQERLKILVPHISEDEKQKKDAIILMDLRTASLGLHPLNYSESVTAKIKQSITENDFTLIAKDCFPEEFN